MAPRWGSFCWRRGCRCLCSPPAGPTTAEARDRPDEAPGEAPGPEPGGPQADPAAEDSVLLGDVHARIRAYGSLAAEVADVGVPGVVAMRYNVYVVTAAQFAADLYAHLLSGRSLGQAATAARRALADDPIRLVTAIPVVLQDWAVPIVYEATPLVLLRSPEQDVPVVRLTPAETRTGQDSAATGGVPEPPDAGFFGRDETLLALDRAFDTNPAALLHAYAGAGKSSTAAEFARWYQVTGGLDDPDHPDWGPGAVLWSSFEHHLTADQVIGTVGDYFSGLLEANGIAWHGITDPDQRRGLIMQVLSQLPALWVWDHVESVTGFPQAPPATGHLPSRTSSRICCVTSPSTPAARCCSPPAAMSIPGSEIFPRGSACPRCRCGKACNWPPHWPPGTARP